MRRAEATVKEKNKSKRGRRVDSVEIKILEQPSEGQAPPDVSPRVSHAASVFGKLWFLATERYTRDMLQNLPRSVCSGTRMFVQERVSALCWDVHAV